MRGETFRARPSAVNAFSYVGNDADEALAEFLDASPGSVSAGSREGTGRLWLTI
jgi:hypothetical protein